MCLPTFCQSHPDKPTMPGQTRFMRIALNVIIGRRLSSVVRMDSLSSACGALRSLYFWRRQLWCVCVADTLPLVSQDHHVQLSNQPNTPMCWNCRCPGDNGPFCLFNFSENSLKNVQPPPFSVVMNSSHWFSTVPIELWLAPPPNMIICVGHATYQHALFSSQFCCYMCCSCYLRLSSNNFYNLLMAAEKDSTSLQQQIIFNP